MLRRILAPLAVAVTAALALPADAHAGSSFKVFTSRAAFLAAAQAGGVSRPEITSGASATVDDGRSATVDGVNAFAFDPAASLAARTTGGVFDLFTGSSAGRFIFSAPTPGNSSQGAFALGFGFTANTAGTYVARATDFDILPGSPIPGLLELSETFTLQAGESRYFGYVADPGQQRIALDASLELEANASATVTNFDVADEATVTPEPATFVLLGAGLAGAGLVARRRARA